MVAGERISSRRGGSGAGQAFRGVVVFMGFVFRERVRADEVDEAWRSAV